MAGKGNTWAADVLALLFQAVTAANIAENASSSPITNIYVSLHTADPGPGGNQNSNETNYTSYARVGVVRTTSGWSLSSETMSNVAAITFPAATGGSSTVTYVGIGTLASGAGLLLYSGALTASVNISNGVQPQFGIGALTVTES
jgi:hypothetical protein